MMITTTSGIHSYEDVQNQGIYPKDSLNTFGGGIKLCKYLLKESDSMWSNGFILGEQQNTNNQKTKLTLKLRCSENIVQKKDTSTLVYKCYYFYLLYLKIIVFKIQC